MCERECVILFLLVPTSVHQRKHRSGCTRGRESSRLVRAFLDSFAQRARALLQGELDVIVQQVSVFMQHHVVTRAVQLLKAQLARILIENLLNRILQLFP